MLDQSPLPSRFDAGNAIDPTHDRHHGETIVTVMWRYKWLIGILLPLGTLLGYWINRQKPTTYRATSKLMFKSDTPLTLDTSTGVVSGGIPSGNLMQSLITSDAIAGRVRLDGQLRKVSALSEMSDDEFIATVRSGIRFETVTDVKDSRDRLIATINFDGKDPDVCVAAVTAVNKAIGVHFKEEREARVNEFGSLIGNAQEKLLPQQVDLEKQYQQFRQNAPLEWDPEGLAVNPHRQRQTQLQGFRDQLESKKRVLDCELRFAESMTDRHDNPLMVALIIGQLSDVFEDSRVMLKGKPSDSLIAGDLELQQIEVEKTLIPLMIKREQLETAYGKSHPEVQSIAMQIERSQSKLNDLITQGSRRRQELNAKNQLGGGTEGFHEAQAAHAREAVDAYIRGLKERLLVTREDIAELDSQIAVEKQQADELKKYEDIDASLRRQIASVQGMLIQLEQQLAALKLVDVNGGIMVEPLMDIGKAFPTGPDLK
ncbi:MAG: hypothetical protein KDB00_00880, partial [Planctomycetales bacterium]|nr:hypothetical protein [Planctomycetales bacterium]